MKSRLIVFVLLSIFHKIHSRKYDHNILIVSNFYDLYPYRKKIECVIDIRTELNKTATSTVREPLFLKYTGNEYKLMIPDDGELKFRNGESALIACTSDSKPNTLTFSKFTLQLYNDNPYIF
jgi:hypothetical protein